MEHRLPEMDEAREYALSEACSANALLNELVDILYNADSVVVAAYFCLAYPLGEEEIISLRDAWNHENEDLLAEFLQVGNIIIHDPESVELDQFILFTKRVRETRDSIARTFRSNQ